MQVKFILPTCTLICLVTSHDIIHFCLQYANIRTNEIFKITTNAINCISHKMLNDVLEPTILKILKKSVMYSKEEE